MSKNTRKNTAWSDSVTPEHWIAYRFVPEAQLYQVDMYVKVQTPRGVRQLLWWIPKYDEAQVLREALAQGRFSLRPYRVGRGADSTNAACIDALYHHFCAAMHLDPEELYYRAYQKREEPDYDVLLTRQLAEWQGLIYPDWGNEKEALKLLRDLTAVNNHGLVTAICDALPDLALRFYPVRERRTGHRFLRSEGG